MIKVSPELRKLVDEFENATLDWSWQRNNGYDQTHIDGAEKRFKKAKRALVIAIRKLES